MSTTRKVPSKVHSIFIDLLTYHKIKMYDMFCMFVCL